MGADLKGRAMGTDMVIPWAGNLDPRYLVYNLGL